MKVTFAVPLLGQRSNVGQSHIASVDGPVLTLTKFSPDRAWHSRARPKYQSLSPKCQSLCLHVGQRSNVGKSRMANVDGSSGHPNQV